MLETSDILDSQQVQLARAPMPTRSHNRQGMASMRSLLGGIALKASVAPMNLVDLLMSKGAEPDLQEPPLPSLARLSLLRLWQLTPFGTARSWPSSDALVFVQQLSWWFVQESYASRLAPLLAKRLLGSEMPVQWCANIHQER